MDFLRGSTHALMIKSEMKIGMDDQIGVSETTESTKDKAVWKISTLLTPRRTTTRKGHSSSRRSNIRQESPLLEKTKRKSSSQINNSPPQSTVSFTAVLEDASRTSSHEEASFEEESDPEPKPEQEENQHSPRKQVSNQISTASAWSAEDESSGAISPAVSQHTSKLSHQTTSQQQSSYHLSSASSSQEELVVSPNQDSTPHMSSVTSTAASISVLASLEEELTTTSQNSSSSLLMPVVQSKQSTNRSTHLTHDIEQKEEEHFSNLENAENPSRLSQRSELRPAALSSLLLRAIAMKQREQEEEKQTLIVTQGLRAEEAVSNDKSVKNETVVVQAEEDSAKTKFNVMQQGWTAEIEVTAESEKETESKTRQKEIEQKNEIVKTKTIYYQDEQVPNINNYVMTKLKSEIGIVHGVIARGVDEWSTQDDNSSEATDDSDDNKEEDEEQRLTLLEELKKQVKQCQLRIHLSADVEIAAFAVDNMGLFVTVAHPLMEFNLRPKHKVQCSTPFNKLIECQILKMDGRLNLALIVWKKNVKNVTFLDLARKSNVGEACYAFPTADPCLQQILAGHIQQTDYMDCRGILQQPLVVSTLPALGIACGLPLVNSKGQILAIIHCSVRQPGCLSLIGGTSADTIQRFITTGKSGPTLGITVQFLEGLRILTGCQKLKVGDCLLSMNDNQFPLKTPIDWKKALEFCASQPVGQQVTLTVDRPKYETIFVLKHQLVKKSTQVDLNWPLQPATIYLPPVLQHQERDVDIRLLRPYRAI